MKNVMEEIKVGGRALGSSQPPFIVAEMSGNHNQSLDRALGIVEAAAGAGAHAMKLQTYTADTITIDYDKDEFFISDPGSPWKGASLYKLYQQAHTPWEWHKPIFKKCKELGLICFSAPFDFTAVDFLEGLDCPCYKIASFENIDIPLIQKVAATGKPLIISTGMATTEELSDAVSAARMAGCKELILLKCTSTYPAASANSNLATIPDMRERFECHVGLSDHTLGLAAPLASISFGAVMIEKHFTLSRADGGVDSFFSLEPAELKFLVEESARAFESIGKVSYGPTEDEKSSLVFRRSLYVVSDMKSGNIFSPDNLRSIRPGYGLPPKHYSEIMGKKAVRDINRGTALNWEMVQNK